MTRDDDQPRHGRRGRAGQREERGHEEGERRRMMAVGRCDTGLRIVEDVVRARRGQAESQMAQGESRVHGAVVFVQKPPVPCQSKAQQASSAEDDRGARERESIGRKPRGGARPSRRYSRNSWSRISRMNRSMDTG
jgi:hypothetical protein